MNFRFTPEEEAFRQEVHDFIEKECPPELRTGDIVSSIRLLPQWRKKLVDKRWLAPAWPREYGGAGMAVMQQFIYNLEMARMRTPGIGLVGGLAVAVVGPTILSHGTEEQKREFIPPILSGEHVWCQGFSEPGAGSDLAAVATRAVRDGDDWVINGQKMWTSWAHRADYVLLLVRTDPEAPRHKGLSFFLVDMKSPGISLLAIHSIHGAHEANQVFLDNVRAPAGCLLGGEPNRGWYQAAHALDIERSGVGTAVAHQQDVEELVSFVRERRGEAVVRIDADQALRHELAERYVEAEVAMALSFRIVTLQVRGIVANHEASASKLFASELGQRIAHTGLRLLGLYGQLARDSKWAPLRGRFEHRYMTSLVDTIGGGTSEIQRNVIALRGLGLPRG